MARNLNTYLGSVVSRTVFRQCYSRLYSSDTKVQTTEENDMPEIVIPYRIPRGPTDILRTLESTLKKDYTAPKYKYADDPYFIPVSNITKRSFALSKEAGKKAARYFLEKHPYIFKVHTSEPLVKAFQPPVIYTEKSEVTEENLVSCIESIDVANCISVYELLTSKGITLKEETKQKLLELLCFYNSTVPPREEYYEERWFARKDELATRNRWLANNLAERLFQEMDKTSSAYCTMIQGTTKYGNSEQAFLLYDEMREKGLPATLETYNGLLTIVPRMREDGDMRWQHAMDLVNNMNAEGLKPDLYTMNALMSIISLSGRWSKGRSIALQVLAEMKSLDIEPSLGTYYYLLIIFYRNSRGIAPILPQIMDKLDGTEPELRHPADVMFFHTAMEACYKGDNDTDMAHRINAFFEYGNNHKFIASSFTESIYFQNYLRLLSYAEEFDKFMLTYERYVPNIYTPEPSITLDILMALDFNGGYKHLTRLCSDVMLFEQTEREDVLTELLRICGSVTLEDQDQELLVRLTWGIMEKIDKRLENKMRRFMQWTGQMMGCLMKIFLNGKDLEKSWIIMQRLKNEEFSLVGLPEMESLTMFCKQFLEAKEFEKVAFCMRYAVLVLNSDLKTTVEEIANDLMEKKLLDEDDREEMNKILQFILEEDKNVEGNKQEERIKISASEINTNTDNGQQENNTETSELKDNKR